MPLRNHLSLLLMGCLTVAGAAVAASGSGASPAGPESLAFWPQWRGPLGNGVGPAATPPTEWSVSKNIAWKAAVPGTGKSSPIVWQDRVYVTTAAPAGGAGKSAAAAPQPGRRGGNPPPEGALDFIVLAYDRNSGREAWRKVVRTETPHEGTHENGTYASGSALTDGRRLYAYFGSRGLYAMDFSGKVLWEKDLGDMQTRMGFGEGNSPALYDNTLVVIWDHEGEDFIVALDATTGEERWRRPREEPTTWATPLIVTHDGRAQVIVNGTNKVVSYDLRSGETVWETPGTTLNAIPSPVAADGMVFAMAGFRGSMVRAINLANARGTLTGPPGEVWTYDRDTPYVPSPLLYEGKLYFLKSNSGILTCLDAATGKVHYTTRLEGAPNVYASPVAADGRVYIVGREGTTVVLQAGPELRVIATNPLDEPIDASPALVDDQIYLRSMGHLYRIEGT